MAEGVWAFISFLVKYGPTIWAAIQEGKDEITLTIRLRRFKTAAEKAEETGDQRDLENQFNPGAHPDAKDK